MRSHTFFVALVVLSIASSIHGQGDLVLNGQSIQMAGHHVYNTFSMIGSTITVTPFDGNDYVNSGTLSIQANSITIDTTSRIMARGAGHRDALCDKGEAPPGFPDASGRGGCAVFDSGGGGAHIGSGGYGTKDCGGANLVCQFPQDEEEDCGGVPVGGTCSSYTDCRIRSPTEVPLSRTRGIAFRHDVHDPVLGFGAAGGDAGCRDGDGFPNNVGGNGGGKVILNSTGPLNINGRVDVDGHRGCSLQNDSGGGGAGGTIYLIAQTLTLSDTSFVTARGGSGGDSQPKNLAEFPECVNTQLQGTCDDCGGGGGGGLIYIKAAGGNFMDYRFTGIFVDGALGGACEGCNQEAGGTPGRVQIGSLGEICNGVDDSYDGIIDEDQPLLQPCGLPSCVNGVLVPECPPPDTQSTTSTTQTSTTSTQTSTTQTSSTSTTDTNAPTSTTNPTDGPGTSTNQQTSTSTAGTGQTTATGTATDGTNGTQDYVESAATALASVMSIAVVALAAIPLLL